MIQGSGPGGRIVRNDIDKAAALAPAMLAETSLPPSPPASVYGPPAGVPFEAIKLSTMRKVIARRLVESKATVPHFYLTVDVKVDALLEVALRAEYGARHQAVAQ